jgi:hypothetical protein
MHIWEDALGGDDPVMIWTRAMMPFRVSPQVVADFTVQIQGPETYLWLATWKQWPGDVSLDLSGDYPGAGLHRYCLVSVDGATNLAQISCGVAVATAVPIPFANYPTPPWGSIPLALVHLGGAAVAGNEIVEASIVDSRIIVASAAGSILPAVHDHTTVAQGDASKAEVLAWIGW